MFNCANCDKETDEQYWCPNCYKDGMCEDCLEFDHRCRRPKERRRNQEEQ